MIKLYERAFGGMNKYYTLATLLGFLLVWGDMKLSGQFGATISANMEVIAMGISLASGILLVLAAYHYFKGVKWIGQGLAAVWLIAFGFNVYSNMGVATSDRQQNIVNADFANDTRGDKIKTRDEMQKKLAFFEGRRAKLEDQMATLSEKQVGGWSITVTPGQSPDSFDGMIQAKTLERDNESKRGGCGPKCEARTNELAHLQSLRALAVSLKDNKEQHAATLKVLDKTRKDIAATPPGHSTVKAQSSLHALIGDFRLSGEVSKDNLQASNNFTGVFVAFVLAIVAAGITLASAWPIIMAAPAMAINVAREQVFSEPVAHGPLTGSLGDAKIRDILNRAEREREIEPVRKAPRDVAQSPDLSASGLDIWAMIKKMQNQATA